MNEIKYNVNVFINKNNDIDLKKVFNQKLLKIIYLIEKNISNSQV